MQSGDLILFRDICDALDASLYINIQHPSYDFKKSIEDESLFRDYERKTGVSYDFSGAEERLDVTLRYYQKLALYFAKYYFEKRYLQGGDDNNKLTYWMATGSGKTVVMKANIIDYFEYLRDKNPSDIEVIVTSPLKELVEQLRKEIGAFFATEFFEDFNFTYKIETTQALINKYETESFEIVGDTQYRLLIVDEAHIGLGGKEKGAFVKLRDALTKNKTNSFMFEYSATFYDVTEPSQVEAYARRIIYEYDYGKFHNDGYGKDFKFGIVGKDEIAENENEDIRKNLDANFEAFREKMAAFDAFNVLQSRSGGRLFPDRPLLVMAGNTVVSSSVDKANNQENSDIAKIVGYLANLDETACKRFADIFNDGNGTLHLFSSGANEGEIVMAYGEVSKPFGLITVGSAKAFLKNEHIQTLAKEGKIVLKNIKFVDEAYLFKNIDESFSPVNVLIGSRKFSAGWNSFRVSQICLINFGTGSGSTIVQIFGRGVRLRGLDGDGKRQEARYVEESENCAKETFEEWSVNRKLTKENYDKLKYLETLFIYSLRKTYLRTFIESDTDICKKSITVVKEVSLNDAVQTKTLPIFRLDKAAKTEKEIRMRLGGYNGNMLTAVYAVADGALQDGASVSVGLPITLDFAVDAKNAEEISGEAIRRLERFVDKAYLEKLLYLRSKKHGVHIDGFGVEDIVGMIVKKKIVIKYDGIVRTPQQFQKIVLKAANALFSKLKNTIVRKETKDSYKYNQKIDREDCIAGYEAKFVLKPSADVTEVKRRLKEDETYKIFVERFLNHYYLPLALDPNANTKPHYKAYEKCLSERFTQNHENIVDCFEEYFDGIETVKVSPDRLNPGEFRFLCDLHRYIEKKRLDVVVLRNKSQGNIGLIGEGEIFYPDFVLWYETGRTIHIVFCDPKGIRNPETQWKVCEAPYFVKELEEKWNACKTDDVKEIKLHAFTVSVTPKNAVSWSPVSRINTEQCAAFYNLVFMEDDAYIDKIFASLDTDIRIHKDFVKYLPMYNDETIEKWLNEAERNVCLQTIDAIDEAKDLERSQQILLYFMLYEKRKDFENVTQEITEEILLEAISELANIFVPSSKLVIKLYRLIKNKTK